MRISDWSSDVCSSDLFSRYDGTRLGTGSRYQPDRRLARRPGRCPPHGPSWARQHYQHKLNRSEEHTSELQSLMRISYAVFCLKKKNNTISYHHQQSTHHTNHHSRITDPHTDIIHNPI